MSDLRLDASSGQAAVEADVESFGRQVSASGIKHSFLITGPQTVWVGEDGEVIWRTGEFDKDGQVVWRVDNTTNPGKFADPCGGQRLPNGNTIVCSYGQRDAKKPRISEITPDKKIVWEFFHPKAGAHEVHVLTTDGEKVAGKPLR